MTQPWRPVHDSVDKSNRPVDRYGLLARRATVVFIVGAWLTVFVGLLVVALIRWWL